MDKFLNFSLISKRGIIKGVKGGEKNKGNEQEVSTLPSFFKEGEGERTNKLYLKLYQLFLK